MADEKKHNILVVDDESGIRASLTILLGSAGYEVAQAEHGFDALLQLKRRVPDVVISDLNMPYMSGFEFLSVIRRRFPQVPVRDESDVEIAKSYEGIADFLLLDTWKSGEPEIGACGLVHDWAIRR